MDRKKIKIWVVILAVLGFLLVTGFRAFNERGQPQVELLTQTKDPVTGKVTSEEREYFPNAAEAAAAKKRRDDAEAGIKRK